MLPCVLFASLLTAAAADVCPTRHTHLIAYTQKGFLPATGFAERYDDTNPTSKPKDMRAQIVQLLGRFASTCRTRSTSSKTSGQFFANRADGR